MTTISGSLVFGTSEIKTEDYIMFAKIMARAGESTPVISLQLEAIDDLLKIQKMESIIIAAQRTKKGMLRKGSSIYDLMNKRINLLIEDLQTIN